MLWESNAIARCLARQYGAAPFAPSEPRAWAAADKWMDWMSLSFSAPFKDLFRHLVRSTPETRDDEAMERGRAQCAKLIGAADEALTRTPWLSGDAFGFGDIPLGCIAYAWFNLPIERPDHPALAAW